MSIELLVDIGDIYTKYIILDRGEPVKKESFLSLLAPYPAPNEIFEFEEKVYFDDSKGWLVGWVANLADDCVPLGSAPNANHVRLLLSKILFDNFDWNQSVRISLAYDMGEKADAIQSVAEYINGNGITFKAGYSYKDDIGEKEMALQVECIPSPISIFEHMNHQRELESLLILDIGYFRSKLCIVNREKGADYFKTIQTGAEAYYNEISHKFRELEKKVDKFYLMKELEFSYPYIRLGKESFDVSGVVQNVRWDLNKDLIIHISNVLKDYFAKTGSAVDSFFITGGGAIFNGSLIRSWLIGENYPDDRIFIDRQARYTVSRSLLHRNRLEAIS